MRRNVVRRPFHFQTRILHRNRQPAKAHYRQINHVIAHKRHLLRAKLFLPQNFLERRPLVMNPLAHLLHLQIPPPQRHRLRLPLRNQPRLDPRLLQNRNPHAIVRMKPLRLDQALRRPSRRRENPDLPIRHHSVHIKKKQLDLLSPCFRHAGSLSGLCGAGALARVVLGLDSKAKSRAKTAPLGPGCHASQSEQFTKLPDLRRISPCSSPSLTPLPR